jgi:hypothetical protein
LRAFLSDGGIYPHSRRRLEQRISAYGNTDLQRREVSRAT